MTPDLVLFDCDGVLVDSEPASVAILQEDLAGRGLVLSLAEIDRLFTGGTMATAGEQARGMGAEIPEEWVARIYTRLYARLAEGVPLIPGIVQALDRLDAAGIPYAVGSNGSEQKMGITLGAHPVLWDRLKDRLYSAHTLGVAKPDPGLYLKPATDAGIPPARCVVIDDSPAGCRAGIAAGMRTLGFAAHDDGARLKALGAEVFHDMHDLPSLLGL